MRFSTFTVATPEWSPAEAAEQLAAQGWDGVEWRITDQAEAAEPGFWAGNRATFALTGLEERLGEVAAITSGAGLAYSGLGGYAHSYERDDVARLLAATARLGAGRLRVRLPRSRYGHYREVFAQTRADLEWASARAGELGVKVLIELHQFTIAASASAAYRLVDGLDPTRIGVIHDLGNLVIEGQEDHLGAFQLLGEYLAHVHVKNARWVRGAEGAWRHEWAPFTEGIADIDTYFADLAAIGYDGWVTSEDFSAERPLAERTAGNLAVLRAARERHYGGAA